jgi:GT2 family glycosyltransferase
VPEVGAQPAVVVPAFGRLESTRRALKSLVDAGAGRIVLVDDEGRGHGDELRREFPAVEILRTETPVYWTGAIRLGVEHALATGARSVLFFNQDVTVPPGYFQRLSETTERFPGAVIGSAVVYAQREGVVWSAGARMEWFGRGFRVLHHGDSAEGLPGEPFPVDWLFGMGTCVPAGVFDRIGLPDSDRFPMAWGDADFTLRARGAGIPILLDPRLRLSHEVGRYDARVAPAPTFVEYVSWLRSPIHNISLSAQREVWRRHGPRGLWRVSFALRFLFLLVNFVRIRILYPTVR